MRRIATLMVAMGLALGLLAGTASAGNHEWEHVPAHGHVMLINVEVINGEDHYDRCVDLAGGRVLRGPAHHHSVHTGNAGGSPFVMGPLFKAGNWVAPMAPLTPFTGCDDVPNPLPSPD